MPLAYGVGILHIVLVNAGVLLGLVFLEDRDARALASKDARRCLLSDIHNDLFHKLLVFALPEKVFNVEWLQIVLTRPRHLLFIDELELSRLSSAKRGVSASLPDPSKVPSAYHSLRSICLVILVLI